MDDVKARQLDYAGLGPGVAETFAENGVACLRGLVDPAWVEHLREWVDIVIAAPTPRSKVNSNHTYIVEPHLWRNFAGFRRFAFESRIAEAAGAVMGSRQVRMYNAPCS